MKEYVSQFPSNHCTCYKPNLRNMSLFWLDALRRGYICLFHLSFVNSLRLYSNKWFYLRSWETIALTRLPYQSCCCHSVPHSICFWTTSSWAFWLRPSASRMMTLNSRMGSTPGNDLRHFHLEGGKLHRTSAPSVKA